MADGESVRVMSEYAPGEKETAANEGAFHGPTGEPNVKGHVAVSPNLLVPNGGAHWYGEHVNLVDKKTGEVLRKGLQIHDFSYWNKETPTKDSVELADDHELPDSILVHDPEYPDEKPTEHQQNYGKISSEQLARSQYRAGDVPEGATFKRANSAPSDAIQKRPATQDELSASTSAYQAKAQQEAPPETTPQPEASTEPPPFQAVPSNPVKNTNQIRQQALENGEDPDDAVAGVHSEAVAENPDDNRVALRTNPDTGSIRMVGNYFVPGDEHHAELLSEMDPEHQAKLPAISQAINRAGPFSFLYGSAPQEGGAAQWAGEAPTGESRGYEQSISSAQHRIGGGETQQQHVMMLPMQLVAEGKPGNRSVSLEGYASQSAINNARNIIGGANAAKIPVPYLSHTDPKFQKDLMGFLENQGNGYRGDGSGPVLDESGNPHKSYKPENGYVPHLLQKPEAEFIHAALNIRPGKKKMSPGPAPSFRERAQWIRRINEAYAGHVAGQNTLLDKLDAKLPKVGVRNSKGDITRYVPWSHNRGTLESTWRKYRPELMSHLGMPPIGSHSMRELAGAHMVHRPPVFRQHAAEFQEHPPAPISGNPEVGAPAGTPGTPPEAGLLAGDAGETEQMPQTTPAEPTEQPSFEAYSPNLRDNMAFRTAKTALKKPQHAELRDFSSDLENAVANRYRKPIAQTKDIVGDWADSAENSLMSRVRGHHPDVRRLVQALKGTHGAQKQVLTFRPHDDGPHNMYSLRFNTDDGEEVRKLLDKQKLLYRSLELPDRKGEGVQAHIVDTGKRNESYNKLEPLFKKGYIGEGHHWPGTAEFVGDPNGANRETARNEYARILDEAEKAWHQNPPGGGGPFDRNADEPEGTPPWWKPFRDRAEENFQKLRESDLFQEQALAQDRVEADAQRQNKTAREKALQRHDRELGQQYVKDNPVAHWHGGHYILDDHEQFPDWVKTKEDIAKFFGDRNPRLDYSKPEHRQIAIDALFDDGMRELAAGSEASNWYNRTVDRSLHKVSEVAPDILKNEEDRLAYLLSTAITSQGQEVIPNWQSGYLNYRHWKKHGEFSLDPAVFKGAGKALTAMVENFDKTNKLWKGTPEKPGLGTKKFLKFLTTQMTMKQLEDAYGTNVSGENKDYSMEGAAYLGPKIGSFFNNMNKRFHTITFDLWKARNMNRMAGNMFGFSDTAMRGGTRKTSEPPHLDKLEEHLNNGTLAGHASASPEEQAQMRDEIAKLRAIPPGQMTRELAMETAPKITEWAERAHKLLAHGELLPAKEGEEPKLKTYSPRTAPNMLAKNFDENFHGLQDAPRNGEERAQWREIEKGVQKKFKDYGIHITLADMQALDWWMEQKLFQKAGSRTKPLSDYLDASHTLVRLINTGFLPKLHE